MKFHKVKIVTKGAVGFGMEAFLDDVKVKGLRRVEFRAGCEEVTTVRLEIAAETLEFEGNAMTGQLVNAMKFDPEKLEAGVKRAQEQIRKANESRQSQ